MTIHTLHDIALHYTSQLHSIRSDYITLHCTTWNIIHMCMFIRIHTYISYMCPRIHVHTNVHIRTSRYIHILYHQILSYHVLSHCNSSFFNLILKTNKNLMYLKCLICGIYIYISYK